MRRGRKISREDISNILKSLLLSVLVDGEQKFVMVLLRADRRLNELKLKKLELFTGNWRLHRRMN